MVLGVIAHGDVVRVDFGIPRGSESAKIRPAVVLQEDWLLATDIATVLVVPLTPNLALDPYPAGHLPGYLLSKIAPGIRLVTGI
jgi:mRNA interferase MazF